MIHWNSPISISGEVGMACASILMEMRETELTTDNFTRFLHKVIDGNIIQYETSDGRTVGLYEIALENYGAYLKLVERDFEPLIGFRWYR